MVASSSAREPEPEVYRTDLIDLACFLGVFFQWEVVEPASGSDKVAWRFFGSSEDLQAKLREYQGTVAARSHVVRRQMMESTKPFRKHRER